jgi:glycosidase
MRLAAAAVLAVFAAACTPQTDRAAPSAPESAPSDAADPYAPKPFVTLENPEWTRDAVLYQINTRQFTPEGTFAAAERELPRLKELGVDILWLMPIHPIGEKNRKGSLGSPYSVKDYLGVNPEFGTIDDLKSFVDAAHEQGFKVILDWVANHSAWDNPLVTEHPDWYIKDWKGDFQPTPWWDWSDIIDFDWSNRDLREYMTKAMVYWVKEVGVDGYRCDVAGYVPLDFWENARAELEAVKPVFMLAEFNHRDVHRASFDASYAWAWNNAMHDIAVGKANTGALYGYFSENESAFPAEAMRMTYVENHDQNAWEGTSFERFRDALPAAMVLSFIGEGIPLVHNGVEAGNEKRLEFFEKDPIAWREHPNGALLKRLIAYRKAHPALANGKWGARMVAVDNSSPQQIFSFLREKEGDRVFVVMNFSGETKSVTFPTAQAAGDYVDFDGGKVTINPETPMTIEPWGWRVMAR